ncbi:MAG: CYTH domain-containing protein [Deltaproteobacteria bacterium]|nr:CYTH domain-containing protein [Deltaproteobacteria bacterium]
MGKEIERKYLVRDDAYKRLAEGLLYRQGYLNSEKERTVRVRTVGDKGFLTIKGVTVGASRLEFEYEIPAIDADDLLEKLCERPLIEKKRHVIEHEGLKWEVDEFVGDNEGLIVAEVELKSEAQRFEKPPWVGDEVTGDPRYFNSNLIKNPYKNWRKTGN